MLVFSFKKKDSTTYLIHSYYGLADNVVCNLKVNINKQKKEAFKILRPELEEDPVDNPFFDSRVGIDKKKLVRAKRSAFQFVEEGKWSKQAEMLRLKVRNSSIKLSLNF